MFVCRFYAVWTSRASYRGQTPVQRRCFSSVGGWNPLTTVRRTFRMTCQFPPFTAWRQKTKRGCALISSDHGRTCPLFESATDFVLAVQVQEAEALLYEPKESAAQHGEAPEPRNPPRNPALSMEMLQPWQPCQLGQACTKQHSGSNVSFSHDTEGGKEDQVRSKL